jgi:2-polyprenyl-6-hydroxyphenyl methylase / 3-demethylubiquinone-9 3-methyltransferase
MSPSVGSPSLHLRVLQSCYISIMAPRQPTDRLSDEELRAIYDQRYVDIYDPHAVQRMRRMLPFFALSGDARVADFGCGNGVLLELIGPRVREYVGVDFSEPFVRAAERRRDAHGITNGRFECADIAAFCEQHPNQFDVAFALDFSEHLYDDQFLRSFRAIHGALKPGAPLYLHTPNAEYFLECFHTWGILNQVEGHVAVRDARSHQRLLEQSGFTKVDVRYLPHYLYLASKLNFLGALPLVGPHFRARLFLTCWKDR